MSWLFVSICLFMLVVAGCAYLFACSGGALDDDNEIGQRPTRSSSPGRAD